MVPEESSEKKKKKINNNLWSRPRPASLENSSLSSVNSFYCILLYVIEQLHTILYARIEQIKHVCYALHINDLP